MAAYPREGEAPWLRGRWVRRPDGGYQVEGGDLRPVAGSRLKEYDPLDSAGENGEPTLVEALLALPVRENEEGEWDERALVAFTERWGLLGLFRHYIIRRDPVESGSRATTPMVHIEESPTERLLALPMHAYAGTFFPHLRRNRTREANALLSERHTRGEITDGEFLRGLHLSSYDLMPPEEPDEVLEYPAECSARFWDHLSEPVGLFSFSVAEFQHAADLCRRPRTLDAGIQLVNVHLDRVQPILLSGADAASQARGTVLVYRWPSLLAAAYWMLAQDVAKGLAPRQCANETCRQLFTPRRMRRGEGQEQRFCSDRCANRQHARESGRKKKTGTDARTGAVS
jgi:hypothetical protein